MKKSVSIVLVFCLLICLFAGCGSTAPAEPASPTEPASPAEPAAPSTLSFTDDCGRTVEIPAEIRSMVPTAPLGQTILFAIAPDMMVGLASKWDNACEGIIPEEYWDLPYFGQLYVGGDLNIESLALVGPDIVIDIGEVKKSTKDDLDALQAQLGIPCVYIEASLETLPQTFEKLGQLLGREEAGKVLSEYCTKVYDRAVDIMAQVGDDKAQAIYIPAYEGLSVLARDSYHAEMLDMLTDNAAVCEEPISKGTGNPVSMEQIALWDPEYIIFGTEESWQSLQTDPTWQELQAIQAGNYALVPTSPDNWMGSPPGAQRYLGLMWLPAILYPEYCDYDLQAEVTEFYSLFFHCELSAEQYASITENAFIG